MSTRTAFTTLLAVALALAPGAAGPAGHGTPTAVPDPATPAETTAAFDWVMPARTGLDADHDGVIDSRVTPEQVDPQSWPVHFDACASTPAAGATIVRYAWHIDRVPAGEGPQCAGFTYFFPREGKYEVSLTVTDSNNVQAHVIKDIQVQDFLVIALGDSFGSGQGNPDIPIQGPDLDRAQAALDAYMDRLDDLADVEGTYDDTQLKARAVTERQIELIDALQLQVAYCTPGSPMFNVDACADQAPVVSTAIAALTGALGELGLEALVATLDLIQESLAALVATARAAVSDAATLVDEAWRALQGAQAALAPTWQDRRCNRSAAAGQAQAALALEEADPHTSVTFVHLACSGAEITPGILSPYAGVEPPPGAADLPPQIDQALALIGDREVDAVLVSIGGNDVGFGPIIEACMKQEPCHQPPTNVQSSMDLQVVMLCGIQGVFSDACRIWLEGLEGSRSGQEIFAGGSSALPGRYLRLATRLAEAFPAVSAEPGRVYITEYPNAVEDEHGGICSADAQPDPLLMLPGISAGEANWLRDTVSLQLNGIVAGAAADHGWTLVDGIFARFAGRGYCSSAGLFRRIQDSFVMQGTKEGAVHPTASGHSIYSSRILSALLPDFYPGTGGGGGGTVNVPPRPPNDNYATVPDSVAPVVTGAPARPADAGGWYSADVRIDWQATDPAPSSGQPTDPPDSLAAIEGAAITYVSAASCDPRDNCATGSITLSIDKTPPSLACEAPAPAFLLGTSGATVTATVADALSGPQAASVSAAASTATVGAKIVSLTGADKAGNSRAAACGYSVTYGFSGLMAPVNEGGVLNVVKAGRAIPLKWRLTDAVGAPVTSLNTAAVSVKSLDCSSGMTSDLVEETTAGGSGLQNLGDGYYQLNWKTPSSYAGSCKTMRLDLGEGLVHTALVKFQ